MEVKFGQNADLHSLNFFLLNERSMTSQFCYFAQAISAKKCILAVLLYHSIFVRLVIYSLSTFLVKFTYFSSVVINLVTKIYIKRLFLSSNSNKHCHNFRAYHTFI